MCGTPLRALLEQWPTVAVAAALRMIWRRRLRPILRLRALAQLHRQEVRMPPSDETRARRLIEREGYAIMRIHRVCDPDPDGTRLALFRGRWKGDSRAHIEGDKDDDLYTAVVKPDGGGYVEQGW